MWVNIKLINPLLEPINPNQQFYGQGSMGAYFTRDLNIVGSTEQSTTNTVFNYIGDNVPEFEIKRVSTTHSDSTCSLDRVNKKIYLALKPSFSDFDFVDIFCKGRRNIQLLETLEYGSDLITYGIIRGLVRADTATYDWSGDVDGAHQMRIYYSLETETNNPEAVRFEATGAEILVDGVRVAYTNSGALWSQADITIPQATYSYPIISVRGLGRITINNSIPPQPTQWRCYFTQVLFKLTREGNQAGGYWIPQEHFYNPATGEGVIGCDERVSWQNGITLYKQIGSDFWIDAAYCRIEDA